MTLRVVLPLLCLLALYGLASTTETRPEERPSISRTDFGGGSSNVQATTGEASWYRDPASPGGLYAAVHSYRFGDPRYAVKVCRADDDEVCVTVTVRDHMANARRVIDLSPEAFTRLAPLSAGIVRVSVSRVEPVPTLPATDTP